MPVLDKRIALNDTPHMIRVPAAAQHVWFFGYPTMPAEGGMRAI
jgi:hypothetical protein